MINKCGAAATTPGLALLPSQESGQGSQLVICKLTYLKHDFIVVSSII